MLVVDVFLPMDRCDYRELIETRHLEHDSFVVFDGLRWLRYDEELPA